MLISFTLFRTLVGVFGFWVSIAFWNAWLFTQETTVIHDVVGNDRFPSALGLCRFIRGIGSIGGVVVGGNSS